MTRLFENLWVKIAAILLAILLWFHVVTDKTFQNEIKLPLTQIEIAAEHVLVEPPPDSITVLVSARGKTLLRSDWKKNGVKLVASKSRLGRFRLEVTTSNLFLVKGERAELVDVVAPREIILTADRKEERIVQVLSRLVVVPGEGYAVNDKDSLYPAYVKITGPKSGMASIEYVETEKEIIEGVRNDFTKKIALVGPDEYGFKVEPDSVLAFVNVVPVKRKEFSGIPIRMINAPEGINFELYPNTLDLRVAGKAADIDTLTENHISAIADFVLFDQNLTLPVQIILPQSILLLQKSIDSVKIIEK